MKIDPNTRAVVDSIPVGNGPSGIAFGDRAVWVALSGDGELARIDPSSDTVVDKVLVGNGPTGVGVSPGSVWVTNYIDSTVMRVDTASDSVVKTAPRVGSEPVAVAANADGAWVANYGAGTVTQVPLGGQGSRTIGVGNGPSGIAITPTAVWVTNSFDNSLWQIGIDDGNVLRATLVGDGPTGVTVDGSNGVGRQSLRRIGRSGLCDERPVQRPSDPDGRPTRRDDAPARRYLGGGFGAALGPPGRHADVRIPGRLPTRSTPRSATPRRRGRSFHSRTMDWWGSRGSVALRAAPSFRTSRRRSVLSEDGKTYTFDLRPGIRYSNGARVEPQDFCVPSSVSCWSGHRSSPS